MPPLIIAAGIGLAAAAIQTGVQAKQAKKARQQQERQYQESKDRQDKQIADQEAQDKNQQATLGHQGAGQRAAQASRSGSVLTRGGGGQRSILGG